MKRKDVDEFSDGFFDFTLSSPALKIRRLDAEVVPIVDEKESGKPMAFGESMPFQDAFVEQSLESSPIAMDELSCSVPGNEEGAIVLFNLQNNPPSLHSPRAFSLSVDSDFLSEFKNPVIWSNRLYVPKSLVDKTQKQDGNSEPRMDTDAMDIEDNYNFQQRPRGPRNNRVTSVTRGLNQWQQHCMIQQPPSNQSTPITLFGRGA